MRRVAVHEAGHTVARLISSTRGDDLAFATIVPRLDGSLGFVASVPSDTRVMTRRTMLEYLQTVLAGRAAEEIVFGADDVGAGAGGSSTSSDLAVATRFATLVVCQSGLGRTGASCGPPRRRRPRNTRSRAFFATPTATSSPDSRRIGRCSSGWSTPWWRNRSSAVTNCGHWRPGRRPGRHRINDGTGRARTGLMG